MDKKKEVETMNIFDLAIKQVEREGKLSDDKVLNFVLDRAIKIRKHLDLKDRGRAIAEARKKNTK